MYKPQNNADDSENKKTLSEQSAPKSAPAMFGQRIKTAMQTMHLAWQRITWKKTILLLCASLLGLITFALTSWGARWWRIPFFADTQEAVVNGTADVWIHSQNLALLPQHIISAPALKSLLTEDFLFYYQQPSDLLGLKGALRRISFEHQLTLSDHLLTAIADAPADIYLWRDGSNALRYWALSMQRDTLVSLAQTLAALQLKADQQITTVGYVRVQGDKVPVYKVTLSASRQLIVVAHKSHWAVLSDARMISRNEGVLSDEGSSLIERLLGDANAHAQLIGTWAKSTIASTAHAEDTIWLSNEIITQGYSTFVPALHSIRFDYVNAQWQTHGEIMPSLLNPQTQHALWQGMPTGAALCASQPIDANPIQQVLAKSDVTVDIGLWQGGQAAVCWYADAHDHITEPLFSMVLPPNTTVDTSTMQAVFDWAIATDKTYLNTLNDLKRTTRRLEQRLKDSRTQLDEAKRDLKKAEKQLKEKTKKGEDSTTVNDRITWLNEHISDLTERIATTKQAQSENKTAIAAEEEAIKAPALQAQQLTTTQKKGFQWIERTQPLLPAESAEDTSNPILAFKGNRFYFSTKTHLIERALATAERTYPHLLEGAPLLQQGTAFVYVHPDKLSTLLRTTADQALPDSEEDELRRAYNTHLPERLSALAALSPFALTLGPAVQGATPVKGAAWYVLEWKTPATP